MLDPKMPLWMPQGSVRSILALGIVAAFIFGDIPVEIVTLVLGFYFASRVAEDSDTNPPNHPDA